MEREAVVNEVVQALEELGTTDRIKSTGTFMTTSMKVIGVTNPEIKGLIRELRKKYKNWDPEEWIGLCKSLVALDIYEAQILAFVMIGRTKALLAALRRKDIPGLYRNLDNWASVDHFSMGIHGVLWRMGVVTDTDIDRLLSSENHWDRRVAIVSTVSLNLRSRGGTGDTERTLAVCEQVVDERHDMIQKALSWALRELSKSDRDSVVSFMEKYGSRLPSRVIREVNHKLDFGTKN